MARYIDIDTAIKTTIEMCAKVVGHGITQIDAVDIADAFENIPTVDVVPKSEVEELSGKYEDLKLKHIDLVKDYDELIAWGGHIKSKDKAIIRADVAREIFEELERHIYFNFRFAKEESAFGEYSTDYLEGRIEMGNDLKKLIAELKKKYTENME